MPHKIDVSVWVSFIMVFYWVLDTNLINCIFINSKLHILYHNCLIFIVKSTLISSYAIQLYKLNHKPFLFKNIKRFNTVLVQSVKCRSQAFRRLTKPRYKSFTFYHLVLHQCTPFVCQRVIQSGQRAIRTKKYWVTF